METKVIEIKVNSNLGDTSKDVDKLGSSLKSTGIDGKKLNDTIKETESKGGAFSGLTKGLDGLIPQLKGATTAGQGVLKMMWAIVANPLGAIIAAIVGGLTLLFKAFASTKAGGEQLEQIMSGLGAVLDILRDRVLGIGKAITKFFSGDFKGAAEEAKKAVSGFGAEVAKEFQEAANATKSLQEVTDAMRDLGVSRAKLNRDLAKSKELLTDEDASYAQKKEAIDKVRIAEEKQIQAELRNAEKRLAAIKVQNSLSDTNLENLQKQADAESALYQLQEESSRNRRNLDRQERTINRERDAENKAREDERKARQKAIDDEEKIRSDKQKALREEDKKIQDKLDLEKFERDNLAKVKADQKITDDFARMSAGLKAQRDEELKDQEERLKNEEAFNAAKLANQTEFANAIGASLNAISQLFEQGTAASKIAALAEIAIGTGTGFINALTIAQKSAGATGPAAAFAFPIFYATQLAAVLGAASKAKNILSQVKGGGSPQNVSPPSNLGGGGSSAPQQSPQFNVVGTSGINQIAQGLGSQSPIQAYVVGSQVTTQQALDRNIVRTATLGG